MTKLILFLAVVGFGWLAISTMWPRLMDIVRESPLLIPAIVLAGWVAGGVVVSTQTRWRADCIRDDAEKAVQERCSYLDSVLLLDDLSLESRDLVESYRAMRIRKETVWTAAKLLLELDEDRKELNRYRKLLPPKPSIEDLHHPLYEVLGKIQDRINTRIHTIATQVADDVEAIAQRQEAARNVEATMREADIT
ncbi:hypothetical protein [Arthrobacter sp. GAS37]|uniref:hypothetical protein n=1 Tax=Arthrobacter sp. GAS37 TaxID=3156261 RepID=UPI0038504C46